MVLALALTMTLVGAALAATPTSGSITVNPNNNGQTYTLYHLFDAHITFTETPGANEGDDPTYTQAAITYTLPTGKTLDTTGAQWFTVNSNGFIEKTSNLTDDVMKSAEFRTWAKGFGTANATTKTATQDNDPNVKWENLPFGYYLVDSTLGAFVGIDSANPDVTIRDKNNPPSLDKSITGVKDENNANDGSIFNATDANETSDPGQGSNEHAIAQVGDTITYSIVIVAKPGALNYVLTDTMDNGLTPPEAAGVSVMAGTTDLKTQDAGTGKAATVSVSGQTITVNFAQAYLDTITANTTITVTYTATLNDDAVVATDSNDNTARLTWGHDNDSNYTTDDSKVWTAKIGVNKRINEESGDPLAGAGFVLKNSSNKYYQWDETSKVVHWVDSIDNATVRTTNNTGAIDPFEGLPNGTYTLVEKIVPDGYNKTADTTITIANANVTADNLAQTATVINNAGSVLPSTGGIGTTIFYIAGLVLVLGAAAIVIARRKAEQ
jgi:fimbrial isopeptide formation D2 family protein/LPXTG-motif cell wall-anchored protein